MTGYDSLVLPPPNDRFDVRSVDGTRLNVEIYGPDGAPTVVLVHGWICSIVYWARQINALRDEGVRVVAYDLRGHGDSGAPGSAGHSIEALADDLNAVLAAVLAPGEKALLAGHSMGAMAMVAFGSQHPQELDRRVAAAMICSSGVHELISRSRIVPLPLPLAKLAQPLSTKLIGLSPPGGRVNAPIRALIRYTSLTRQASKADVDFCARIINSCSPRTRAEFARTLSNLNLDAEVREFAVPTAVISGTRDRLTPIWHARRLAATLPQLVDFVEVQGAGHMTPVQSADDVNDVLRRLIHDYLPQSAGSRHVVDLTRQRDASNVLPHSTQEIA
jgi:pimeloyl-ACP methyl ester carboxylesterase